MKLEALGPSLIEAFAQVPDPRSRQGRRHPLPAILALATAAMLAGARSLAAITEWGRLQPPPVVRALGFGRDRTPALATLHAVFARLDAVAFEAALQEWLAAPMGAAPAAIAVDGKALRGTFREGSPGLMVVAAYTHEAGLVLAQAGDPAGGGGGRAARRPGAAGDAAAGGPGGDGRRAVLPARA